MTREEIIREIEERSVGEDCRWIAIRCDVAREIAQMLKEQEPKAAWYDPDAPLRFWHCGHCGVCITHGDQYCRVCGKAVKWDD